MIGVLLRFLYSVNTISLKSLLSYIRKRITNIWKPVNNAINNSNYLKYILLQSIIATWKKTQFGLRKCHQESSKELGKCDLGTGIFQSEYVCVLLWWERRGWLWGCFSVKNDYSRQCLRIKIDIFCSLSKKLNANNISVM